MNIFLSVSLRVEYLKVFLLLTLINCLGAGGVRRGHESVGTSSLSTTYYFSLKNVKGYKAE